MAKDILIRSTAVTKLGANAACGEVEVFLENKHAPNMVSLIAPANMEAPSMFKWENAFGWAYAGNIADSSIREPCRGRRRTVPLFPR